MSPPRKMHSLPVSPPFSWLLFLIFLFLIGNIRPSLSYEIGGLYKSCSKLFNCGELSGVDFPFWGEDRSKDCGHPQLELDCNDGVATMEIMNVKYRVLGLENKTNVIRIARDDYLGGICTSKFVNTTLDPMLFDYAAGYTNLTIFYGCPSFSTVGFNVSSCDIDGVPYQGVHVLPGAQGPGLCNISVVVPVIGIDWLKSVNYSGLDQVLRNDGFGVKWKVDNKECIECTRSGGRCGYNPYLNQTTCYCPNKIYGTAACSLSPGAGPPQSSSDAAGNSNNSQTLIIGLAVSGAVVAIALGLLVVFRIKQQKKKIVAQSNKIKGLPTPPSSNGLPTPTTNFSRTTPSYPSSLSTDLEKGSMYFGVQVFTYNELEEATDNFDPARELGEGGFGVVYYGKLRDGRVVAVKRLYENNFKRVEQFINEIEILARLRHQNLVTLYGCTSRRSQGLLLVYEYIPNGTVADHLHGNKSKSGLLTWPVRLSIAIETASALFYLHKSDIIHRDVKTNNILLDNDFQVKVADFGLVRLFPTDVTHVSTAPQGTPGYVDPEYYQCYQLTDKSDVYSFGVVLVELISSLQAVDTNRHRHDINLSNMAINKIQNHTLHELVDPSLGFETDAAVRRMTTLVAELAFRCLQQDRDMRPSMEEVLASLRIIENEEINSTKAEVVDIPSDDVGLLKNMPPPFSPDSVVSFNWANSTAASTF